MDHRSLGWVREQMVQKEEGEQVWGVPELFLPLYAESTYVEWRSTNCKFYKVARDTTSHATDSIYLTIFLHQKNQTNRGINVRLWKQLPETPSPPLNLVYLSYLI